MATSKMVDTIILGAGWSGAVAARELTAKGHSVLVLEARDRIGGRAQTWVAKAGDVKVDVGCSWIHGYKEGNPARGIAKELGVSAHLPKPAEGVIYGPDGALSNSTAAGLRSSLSAAQASFKTPHPAPPPSASLASALLSPSSPLFAQSAKPDPHSDMMSTHPADPTVVATDTKSTSADNALAASLARTLEVPLGVKLEKASLRWAGWESATSFAGSDAAPEGGYEALVAKIFDEASSRGAEVHLNSVVTSVHLDENSVNISTTDGKIYSAKTAICTIPLGVLKTLPDSTFEPVLPARMQEAIKGTHVGVLEKLVLHYPSAWWPNAETIGSYTFLPTSTTALSESSTPEEILAASTLVSANSFCPTLPKPHPTLLTYFSETPARLLLRHPPETVAKAYHQFLISRFKPSTPPPAPSEYDLTDWLINPFSYGATTTPSIISENGERSPMDFKELSRPVWDGRLGFAGEHTEMEHRGSVAGAVLSGQREAERVARFLSRMDEAEKQG